MQNSETLRPYSNRFRYNSYNDGKLRRQRYRYIELLTKGRLLGKEPTTVPELQPFYYYLAGIEELQQEERKNVEAVGGLLPYDNKELDTRGRIDAFKRLGLTTQS